MAKTYLALDAEYHWDEHLFEAHRAIDRKSDRRAVAVKRVMATAVFPFSVDDEGRVSIGDPQSWTEHDWGDEEAILAQTFDYLRTREGQPIFTFGGLATDIPILLLASMTHGLRLPPQLVDQPGRKGPRPHLDLALQLKGGGRTWSHLSQVLLRMGVPPALVAAKPAVRRPASGSEWLDLRDHVELDCLLLAIAKIGWLVSQGHEGLRLQPAINTLVEGFRRRRPDHAAIDALRAYADDLHNAIADGFSFAA